MPVHVALLRGINLGSKRRVAMADLRALLEGLGYDDVRTHLQSGNAVFRAPIRSAAAVEKAVSAAIRAELGLEVAVVSRTAAQLAAVVEADPFAGVAKDPARYLVTFLEKKPPASWLAAIDPETYAPEQAAVVGKRGLPVAAGRGARQQAGPRHHRQEARRLRDQPQLERGAQAGRDGS